MTTTIEKAKLIQAEMVANRRHLHAHPELNYAEYETSKFAAEKLKSLGFSVSMAGGNTGLIADYGSGNTTVAIRCDMDAMSLTELNRSQYAATKAGIMHACGHDAHLACALGAAQLLVAQPLNGKLRIIVQPGEHESGKPGAATMIEAGALEGVSAVLGVHVDATIPTGKVGVVMGSVMQSMQNFMITFAAASGQNSPDDPDLSITVANLITALYKLPNSEKTNVSVHAIEADQARSEGACATIAGAIRAQNADVQLQIQKEIENIVAAAKFPASVVFDREVSPSVDSTAVTSVLHKSAVDLIGVNNVLTTKRKSWSYQFLLLTEHVPGAMIYLGAEIASDRRIHQTATFDIDENCLPIGAAILAEAALRLMLAN